MDANLKILNFSEKKKIHEKPAYSHVHWKAIYWNMRPKTFLLRLQLLATFSFRFRFHFSHDRKESEILGVEQQIADSWSLSPSHGQFYPTRLSRLFYIQVKMLLMNLFKPSYLDCRPILCSCLHDITLYAMNDTTGRFYDNVPLCQPLVVNEL